MPCRSQTDRPECPQALARRGWSHSYNKKDNFVVLCVTLNLRIKSLAQESQPKSQALASCCPQGRTPLLQLGQLCTLAWLEAQLCSALRHSLTSRPLGVVADLPFFYKGCILLCGQMGLALRKVLGHWLLWRPEAKLLSENTEQRRKEGQSRVYLLGEVCLSHSWLRPLWSARGCRVLFCLLSWVVQPCLTVSKSSSMYHSESPGGPSVLSLSPDLKGNFSSQLKVWICMLGVGILNLFPFWKLHCDKSSHLFLLTRSQVGQPASADSAGYLWVYFCKWACLPPCYPGPFPVLWIRPGW